MFYLLVYDDNREDCILHTMTTNRDDLKEIVQGLINQGVGYKVVAGEVIEEMAGVVCNDGEDIWEPVDDGYAEDEDFDEYYQDSNDWEPEENWIDEDRPY